MNLKNIAMWAIIVFLTIGLLGLIHKPISNQVIKLFFLILDSVENGEV